MAPPAAALALLLFFFAKGLDWDRIPAEQAVGPDYSSISGGSRTWTLLSSS